MFITKIAARCQRVRVTNKGNVVPWLMAATVLIHNGCTTGVEAYVMRVPAISYRKTVNDYYDDGFYKLPNRLSHQCFDFDELRVILERILKGELGPAGGPERDALIDYFLAGREGPLACERMVDVLVGFAEEISQTPQPGIWEWLWNRYKANRRRIKKAYRAWQPGSRKSPEFERHRYPGIAAGDLAERISRFQQVLGDNTRLLLHQIYDNVFRISSN